MVTGIGFLGAGAIIREGISIRGLTTAGSLWVVAAIGVAAGAGYWWPAVVGTGLVIFALWPLRALGYLTLERIRQQDDRLVVELREGASVKKLLEELPRARRVEIDDERDRRVVTLDLEHGVAEPALSRLADLEDVIAVRWRR